MSGTGKFAGWQRLFVVAWLQPLLRSGMNVSEVKTIYFLDTSALAQSCNGDALLVQVQQHNVACHTGQRSCLCRVLPLLETVSTASGAESPAPAPTAMFDALYRLLLTRRDTGADTSYVKKLVQRGQDVMCMKVAEEATEVLLASKNGTAAEMVYEIAERK